MRLLDEEETDEILLRLRDARRLVVMPITIFSSLLISSPGISCGLKAAATHILISKKSQPVFYSSGEPKINFVIAIGSTFESESLLGMHQFN